MRLRHVKGAKDTINAYPNLIIDNLDNKVIDFNKIFNNDNPVHIEIGMGKGKFIYSKAFNNKAINFVGIEKFDSVIFRALEKVIENPLDNLFLIRMDANDLLNIFKLDSVNRVYLNFSDPWPKDRHSKRRLTNKKFLDIYKKIMSENSELHFKTDNADLFEYSVDEIKNYPMNVTYITKDLHKSDYEDNIMTEFEEKFSKLGKKIYKLTATFMEE